MTTGKIDNRTIVGQRLDHAIDQLLTGARTSPADRAHLQRFQPSLRGDEDPSWTETVMPVAGLARALDDRLLPRLRDPSVLERARFTTILRSIGEGLEQAVVGGESSRLSDVARNVIRREVERSARLQARIGELVEG